MSSPAHVLRVQRLYRSSLKCLANWTVHRDLWIKKGFELRAEFDANKSVTNPHLIEKLLSDGEAKLAENAHPDPYTGGATPPARFATHIYLRTNPRGCSLNCACACRSADRPGWHQVHAIRQQWPRLQPRGASPHCGFGLEGGASCVARARVGLASSSASYSVDANDDCEFVILTERALPRR